MEKLAGTAYQVINRALEGHSQYREFKAGSCSTQQYVQWLEQNERVLLSPRLNEDRLYLSSRFPCAEETFVDCILDRLVSAGMLPHARYQKQCFEEFRAQIYLRFDHHDRLTYIFPEEERLTFAIANILKPRNIGVFGSYYGYWAIWAFGACSAVGTMVDLNEANNELAQKNLERFQLASRVLLRTCDAVAHLDQSNEEFDFALVDAEGPDSHANPDYIKKYIYYPIFKSLIPRLSRSAAVVAHNILLSNPSASRYFEQSITKNQKQFHKLLPLVEKEFTKFQDFPTSEGIGVFRL